MDGYTTEDQQLENIKNWWRRNGKPIMAGLILGLLIFAGYRFWYQQQDNDAIQASSLYEQMLAAAEEEKKQEVLDRGAAILGQFPKTPYAALASLVLAKYKLEEGDTASAKTYLQWVLDNGKQPGIKHIARVRLARVLLAENKLDESLKLLTETQPDSFVRDYEETKGDILMAQGKFDQARAAYKKALAAVETGMDASDLQLKLDNIGGEETK